MAQIVSLLNGENINQDHQITALHKSLINPWVISGLAVTAGQVAVGEAFVECNRSNGEKIMVHFQNTAPVNIDTSGNKKIFVEIKQANIDNGIINAEDGSNIGEIKSADSYPSKNYIPLASVTVGVIADERKFIGKKIPDIRWQNRRPIDYSAQTFYWPEFVEWATVGLSEAWWINLHTYSSWTVDDFNYKTQLAITSQWPVTGMWIRKAVDNNTWWAWQKIFPFSATALDINWLEWASWTTPHIETSFIMRDPNTWLNNKVSLGMLTKWISQPFSKRPVNIPTANVYNNGDFISNSVAVPNGGFVTIFGGKSTESYSHGSTQLQHSTDNVHFSDFCGVHSTFWVENAFNHASVFVPPGFIRLKAWRTQSGTNNGIVQVF